jgi:hypothetical protein
MNDDFDLYINRQMKNWAACHQPPEDGRERLLRAASSPMPLYEQALRIPFIDFLVKYFAPQTHGYEFVSQSHNVVVKPYSQNQIWLWEFASTWRMAS